MKWLVLCRTLYSASCGLSDNGVRRHRMESAQQAHTYYLYVQRILYENKLWSDEWKIMTSRGRKPNRGKCMLILFFNYTYMLLSLNGVFTHIRAFLFIYGYRSCEHMWQCGQYWWVLQQLLLHSRDRAKKSVWGGHPLLAICENRLIHMTSQTTCAHSSLQNFAKLHNFLTLESVIICLGDSNCSSNECML